MEVYCEAEPGGTQGQNTHTLIRSFQGNIGIGLGLGALPNAWKWAQPLQGTAQQMPQKQNRCIRRSFFAIAEERTKELMDTVFCIMHGSCGPIECYG